MAATRKKKRKVLLIGDDAMLAEWAQRLVEASSETVALTVLPAGEGVRAWLDAASALKLPHLILLDLQLPKLDGLAVLRTLRNHPATQEVPVVCFSAEYTPEDVRLAYRVGANSCVAKPAEEQGFAAFFNAQLEYWLQPGVREQIYAAS